jgi:hypothetical protein
MMSENQGNKIFICSYCEQAIKFRDEQEGKRISCPKCKKTVWVFDNRSVPINARLTSTWMYERRQFLGLLGSKMVGPIPDSEFLELVTMGEIQGEFYVQSPELTQNQEVQANRVNLSIVREMCNQRYAEEQRLRNVRSREEQRSTKNRDTLLLGIKKAIADGNLSLTERNQLSAFASKVGIAESEVQSILLRESSSLLSEVIEEALADGFIDDKENENISRIAIGLGVTLELSKDQQFRLALARTAWKLYQQLQAGQLEQNIEFDGAEVYEIVSLKRPAGIALGDNHYLKSVGVGSVKRADKNVLLDGRLVAKKYSLSSIANIQWFSDGLFLKRLSGKSLFIRPLKLGLEWHKFAMAMEILATGEPVIGILPDESFVPAVDVVVAELANDYAGTDDLADDRDVQPDNWTPTSRIPRFTFRVVGEAFENRYLDLNRLSIGEEVFLIREPHNPFDPNAVAVYSQQRRSLGYLKREVGIWFAPILDKGRLFKCEVKHRTANGGIVIAVFE